MKQDLTTLIGGGVLLWACLTHSAEAQTDAAEDRAKALVASMTPAEKFEQLLNVAPAIERLDIPAYNWWTESLHGALGPTYTTNFPEPIGLGATFDAPLIAKVASAIGGEVRALHDLGRSTGKLGKIGTGLDTWSPNINIFRDPRWGRGQETYGEDPYLTAGLGVAFVQGMQGDDPRRPDIIATPKHFAVHSGPESTRHHANVFVSLHDLEDTYLPAFRAAIVEGQAGSIMCAYNRVNGQPACGSDLLLKTKLREAWGFKGFVVSDCDAVRDIVSNHKYAPDDATSAAVALKAGVDNECHTGTLSFQGGLANKYRAALERGLISQEDIDTALRRLFTARYRTGDLPGVRELAPAPAIHTPANRALALEAAEKSIVLLKNTGVLPLKAGTRIALVGPHGDSTRVLRGNYSSDLVDKPVSLRQGLKDVFGEANVVHVPFPASITDGDRIPGSAYLTPDGKPGLSVSYYEPTEVLPALFSPPDDFQARYRQLKFKTKAKLVRTEPDIGQRGGAIPGLYEHYRAVWTGFIVPPESGTYRIGMSALTGELELDGKIIDKVELRAWNSAPKYVEKVLEKGRRYPIRFTAQVSPTMSSASVMWKRIADAQSIDLRTAARDVDVIVAAVGLSSDLEGEEMPVEIEGFSGGDKTSINLPANQRVLLAEAKATGKPVIVVALNGSTIDLSWAKENSEAILEAWYPGEEGGHAVANILSGRTNPSGRLPLTFYKSVDDLPPFGDYSMRNRTYRYYEGEPVFPFGYGLSYTRFAYAPLRFTDAAAAGTTGVTVTTEVSNKGPVAGDEVVQLYITPPRFEGAPRLALRGFKRVHLKPGETQAVTFTLSPRDLSFVTPDGERRVFAGEHVIGVGGSQPDDSANSVRRTLTIDSSTLVRDEVAQ